MASLTYTAPDGVPARFQLDRERTAIGRSADNDLVITDLSVSRSHAAILRREGQYVLVDRGAALGVVVNGEMIREHTLRHGDRILLGRQALCFEHPESIETTTDDEPDEPEGADPFAWQADIGPLRESIEALAPGKPSPGARSRDRLEEVKRHLRALEKDLARAHHQHEILRTLLWVSRLVHSEKNRDRLGSLIVELAVEVLGAERGFLMLRDEETGELRAGAIHNMNTDEPAPGTISHGIASEVLTKGQGVRSEDAASDPRFQGRPSVLDMGIRSMLCAPLLRRGTPPLGVLYVDRLASDSRFGPDDLESLSGLANVASVALENARLQKEAVRMSRFEEDLLQERKLKALQDDLFAMISHDLRTPLTNVKSWTEILLDGWERIEPGDRQRYLEIVDRECDRLSELVSQMVPRGPRPPLDIRAHPTQPEELVRRATDNLAAAAKAREIELVAFCEPHLPPVLADPRRIAEVFDNLVNNALKFVPRGGRIRLSAAAASTESAARRSGHTVMVDLSEARKARFVRFSVSDNGEGIPEDVLPKVFERGFQVEEAQKGRPRGRGLGLAICREIVERHAGSIAVESRPGKGSKFSFLLPVSRAQ